jgi:hypothetical protein
VDAEHGARVPRGSLDGVAVEGDEDVVARDAADERRLGRRAARQDARAPVADPSARARHRADADGGLLVARGGGEFGRGLRVARRREDARAAEDLGAFRVVEELVRERESTRVEGSGGGVRLRPARRRGTRRVVEARSAE